MHKGTNSADNRSNEQLDASSQDRHSSASAANTSASIPPTVWTTADVDLMLEMDAPVLLPSPSPSPTPTLGLSIGSASRPPSPSPLHTMVLPLDFELDTLHTLLARGTAMVKYPNKASRRPEERIIRVLGLAPDASIEQPLVSQTFVGLGWESRKKKESLSTANLLAIREIRLGQNTKAFELHGKNPDVEERAFSIIYVANGKYKMLNLVAPTKEQCAIWVSGLHMLLANVSVTMSTPPSSTAKSAFPQSITTWLEKIWIDADVHGTGQLGLDSVTQLMGRLNIRLSKIEVKSALKNSGITSRGMLKFEDFERLYRTLRFRPEIGELFSNLAKTDPSGLTFAEFQSFLTNVQKSSISHARCLEIYKKYLPPPRVHLSEALMKLENQNSANFTDAKDDSLPLELMDMDHFSAFLLSANNAVFRKQNTSFVYQDMTLPLTDYIINSSHNTYLLGDQIAGESSVEGYIRALQRGCRCVELDCFDGPNGPVIYHKNSLTNRIPFKDVVEAIHRYAFVASIYPVILSLETHCSFDQQAMMAKILIEILGDSLIALPLSVSAKREDKRDSQGRPHTSILPSPADLIGKILIKGKINPIHPELARTMSHDDLDYESEDDITSSTFSSTSASPQNSAHSHAGKSNGATSRSLLHSPVFDLDSLASSHGDEDSEKGSNADSVLTTGSSDPSCASAASSRIAPSQVFSAANDSRLGRTSSLLHLNTSGSVVNGTGSCSIGAAFVTGANSAVGIAPGSIGIAAAVAPKRMSLRSAHGSAPGHANSTASAGNLLSSPKTDEKVVAKKRYIVEKSLMELVVYFKAVRFTGLDTLDSLKFDEMVSITESKFLSLISKQILPGFSTTASPRLNPQSTPPSPSTSPITKSPLQSPLHSRRSTFNSLSESNLSNPSPQPHLQGIQRWTQHHMRHLTRIYPSPLRINSSNIENPVQLWACGVQMVALNYQTFDRGLQVNHAFFKSNGGCGYVLKAGVHRTWAWRWVLENGWWEWKFVFLGDGGEHDAVAAPQRQLRGPETEMTGKGAYYFGNSDEGVRRHEQDGVTEESLGDSKVVSMMSAAERPMLLTVKVISAQQLPTAKDGGASSVVRLITSPPCVEIEVLGTDMDSVKYKTKPSSTGGFNAIWKESFQFPVSCPELAILRFQVFSSESRMKNEMIGCYAIALDNLELGYRHVPLMNRKGEVIPFSTLFLYLSLA
ncbi:1-phosphatidylinositol 4,5-bisphosphate phosphodiesterase delta-4 [Chytriomyces hyalinus]|nr:1-phosphatidylinositol 4,5-bisphosphate phosphodiesterase delta-4 [Chytriomyces hyalinus]